ncbi:MAG: pseudouridine synthase [Firmicutes bacterium HGW-Firmicutes-12]|nr:MAG: pseudouridine synthase [Firmicutes bacterium HGW-Firmicutes-12]
MERLHKYLARAGMASRRQAENMIKEGRVKVNGIVVKEMGSQIEPGLDEVRLDNKEVVLRDDKIYILLNKPTQVVTTLDDPQKRKKVIDLLKGINERVYPVGRLDFNTEGLLLLTNDGELAYRLTHPKYKVDKVYIADVKGNMREPAITKLRIGIILEDGPTMPAQVRKLKQGNITTIEIAIHEGRNRQVRRMCEAVGHPVLSLKRVKFGPLKLGDLPVGAYRYLELQEIMDIKEACSYQRDD